MSHKIYSVYDSKAEAYLQPLIQKTRGEAIRTFSDLVNNEQTMFAKHPSDFTLFEIGEWDELTGSVTMLQAKQPLGVAIEFVKESDQLEFEKLPRRSPKDYMESIIPEKSN